MVTQAENVEWMRLIGAGSSDPNQIAEALAAHQQSQDQHKRQAEAEMESQQEEERQNRKQNSQASVLSRLLQTLASSSAADNQQQSAAGLQIMQLLNQPAPLQSLIQQPAVSGTDQLLSLLGISNQPKLPVPQSLSMASAIGSTDNNTLCQQLQMLLNSASMGQPSVGNNVQPPSLLQTSSFPSNLGSQPMKLSYSDSVSASLTPGTLPPGDGPFFVVAADSRIQLTATGFHLAIASGPHSNFEDAVASMNAAAQGLIPIRKDAELVHIMSDTPIWHSLDHVHKPMMVVKASSLCSQPAQQEDDDKAHVGTQQIAALLETLKGQSSSAIQQQLLQAVSCGWNSNDSISTQLHPSLL